jgi:hypothetical protein
MNIESRRCICHPLQIPIEVQTLGVGEIHLLSGREMSPGVLAVDVPVMITVGAAVVVRISGIGKDAELHGQVIWFARSAHGYVIGIAFYSEREAFRMRMLEQVCHIEAYRKDVLVNEGRELTSEEAAAEWIACHAVNFPDVLPMAA